MSQVYETVKKLLVENLSIDEAKINENANIMQDLGADSLDLMDLVNELEKSILSRSHRKIMRI